jgi:hypothetical protein
MFQIYRCPACGDFIDTSRLNGTLQRHGVFSASFTCPCCSARLKPSAATYLLVAVTFGIALAQLFSAWEIIHYCFIPLAVMLLVFRSGRGFKVVD